MTELQTLLFEIGTEELPPKSLRQLSEGLGEELLAQLKKSGLVQAGTQYRVYASPRRLAVNVEQVASKQPDQILDRRGPALTAAFDDSGAPTQAALGFARSVGKEVSDLDRQKNDKGEWLYSQVHTPGKPIGEILPGLIESALKALPIAKRMRWGAREAEFIRPVHWLVLMHGADVIDTEILSVKTGRQSRGHRFHSPGQIDVPDADHYTSVLLQQGRVMVDFDVRRDHIAEQSKKLGQQYGGEVILDPDLLDEVTGIVEWPVPLQGRIDAEFMGLPQEVLVSSMQDHQKYFPLADAGGGLLPAFITVCNIQSKDVTRVIQGNERVLRARLSDARFFWEQDKSIPLANRLERLEDVLFHNKLGSVAGKGARIGRLAESFAARLGADPVQVKHAGVLCKADLVTDMVGEFPELQGVMGKYYALNDGEPEKVAQAIEEHYQPRFSGDNIPTSASGIAIALADKLDTICGVFAAGEAPTGDRDPFALRRAALGFLRILIEAGIDLDVRSAITASLNAYTGPDLDLDCDKDIYQFIFERLKQYYQAKGYSTRLFQAVAAIQPASPLDFDRRLKAVSGFADMDAAQSLIEANKRISNILQKSGQEFGQVDEARLLEEKEISLYKAVQVVSERSHPMLEDRDYVAILNALAELKQPVDDFFDQVMVMDEDVGKRNNRIALLYRINQLFGQVADISCLK